MKGWEYYYPRSWLALGTLTGIAATATAHSAWNKQSTTEAVLAGALAILTAFEIHQGISYMRRMREQEEICKRVYKKSLEDRTGE